jgi:hypothetical protein
MKPKKQNQEYFDINEYLPYIPLAFFAIFIKVFSKLSKYYPFSEFFKNRQWHYNNLDVKKINDSVFKVAKVLKLDIDVTGIEKNNYFNCFSYRVNQGNLLIQKFKRILSQRLKLAENKIIIRKNNGKINILVPRNE